jgi:streptomycin 6-kinase
MQSNNTNIFEQTITTMYGPAGERWLQSLPATVTLLANKWHLGNLQPLGNLSYNYVLAGTRSNNPIILKLSFDAKAIAQEAAALNALAGPCVKILEHDITCNALLLEAVVPGTTLKEYFPARDNAAVEITCKLMKSLNTDHQELAHCTTVAQLLTILDKNYPLLNTHLATARIVRNELLQTTCKNILMHGDLHHENILRQGNTWRVIDPKGIIGDQTYECAAFIHNPFPELIKQQNLHDIINQRIQIFAKLLDISEQRIAQWSYVKAVMAACWAIDDNINPNNWIALSNILKNI